MTSKIALCCLALAAAAVAVPAAQGRRAAKSDQETLIQIERDWDAAFLRKDIKFIEGVLADEFMTTYDDGSRGDKARELSLISDFNQQIDSSTLDDFTVRLYGDTAIVWFSRRLVGPSQGRRLELLYRFMDVFVWRDGRWLCTGSQSTKVSAN